MASTKAVTPQAVREVIASVAKRPVEEVQPGSDLMDDLGIRSFSRVELSVLLEDRFGTSLTDEQVMRLKTVADVIAAIGRGTANVGP